jgi:hypothetical protein
MKPFRIHFVMSKKSGRAYIGKGPDGRIDDEHSTEFQRLTRQPDATQWESAPFSSAHDALVAEAAAIGIVKNIGSDVKLVNIQKHYERRFAPRYPIPFVAGQVKKSHLPRAIIVTLAPDTLQDDSRPAPNSAWTPKRLAERARKFWQFRRDRVDSWSKGIGAPYFLVAVVKGSGRILAVFEIDNKRWFSDPENQEPEKKPKNQKRLVAVPVKISKGANANGMQGKQYTGNRQGGAVLYGVQVA